MYHCYIWKLCLQSYHTYGQLLYIIVITSVETKLKVSLSLGMGLIQSWLMPAVEIKLDIVTFLVGYQLFWLDVQSVLSVCLCKYIVKLMTINSLIYLYSLFIWLWKVCYFCLASLWSSWCLKYLQCCSDV